MLKKGSKKGKKNKYQSVTHVSSCILQVLFKNIVSRSAALVTKKLWAILEFFFTDCTFFRPVPFPINQKKNFFTKKTFKLLFIKSQKVSR